MLTIEQVFSQTLWSQMCMHVCSWSTCRCGSLCFTSLQLFVYCLTSQVATLTQLWENAKTPERGCLHLPSLSCRRGFNLKHCAALKSLSSNLLIISNILLLWHCCYFFIFQLEHRKSNFINSYQSTWFLIIAYLFGIFIFVIYLPVLSCFLKL